MNKKALAGRDLLRLFNLSTEELAHVLRTALSNKQAWKRDSRSMQMLNVYSGRAVGIILEKPSLRTRVSFELATSRLGAYPVVMSDTTSAFSRGESLKDTTMVLERYVDAIVIRSFAQSRLEEIASHAQVPVINALTDDFHPCQGLADLMTIYEHKCALGGEAAASAMLGNRDVLASTSTLATHFDPNNLRSIKIAYVGDGNNMAHTYMEAAALCGMELRVATPKDYQPAAKYVEECAQLAAKTGAKLLYTANVQEALHLADVVITDTWASMGAESEHDKRARAFSAYQINSEAMQLAAPDAIFMHCLPAHRGEEVSDEVMDSKQSVIYDEAENRLHAQQALLQLVLE